MQLLNDSFYDHLASFEPEARKEYPKHETIVGSGIRGTVALDVDGVLLDNGNLVEGALSFVRELNKTHRIIIHSCRVSEEVTIDMWNATRRLKARLDEFGIVYDEIWTGKGKPVADWYVDDKGICCNPKEYKDSFQYTLMKIRGELF